MMLKLRIFQKKILLEETYQNFERASLLTSYANFHHFLPLNSSPHYYHQIFKLIP